MGEKIKLIIAALVASEDAMSLAEYVEATTLSIVEVAEGLDLLVGLRIFEADASYHNSDIGEMVYMFADNANAQAIYESFAG